MFTCPFQSYCGTDDLAVIVPSYEGIGQTKDIVVDQSNVFTGSDYCRYMV